MSGPSPLRTYALTPLPRRRRRPPTVRASSRLHSIDCRCSRCWRWQSRLEPFAVALEAARKLSMPFLAGLLVSTAIMEVVDYATGGPGLAVVFGLKAPSK